MLCQTAAKEYYIIAIKNNVELSRDLHLGTVFVQHKNRNVVSCPPPQETNQNFSECLCFIRHSWSSKGTSSGEAQEGISSPPLSCPLVCPWGEWMGSDPSAGFRQMMSQRRGLAYVAGQWWGAAGKEFEHIGLKPVHRYRHAKRWSPIRGPQPALLVADRQDGSEDLGLLRGAELLVSNLDFIQQTHRVPLASSFDFEHSPGDCQRMSYTQSITHRKYSRNNVWLQGLLDCFSDSPRIWKRGEKTFWQMSYSS